MNELHFFPVAGVRLATAAAGIRKADRQDLTVVEIASGAVAAAVFTRNVFCAAPVVVAREHLAAAMPRLLLINSGNANAGTGDQGLEDARTSCREAAARLGCRPEEVLPFSTGVIGQRLPVAKLVAGLDGALAGLVPDAWDRAALGIMTTDTVPKLASVQVETDVGRITITGISKGAGMIKPNMATMLAFIATDACVRGPDLQGLLADKADRTFNRITIDGDTSTNDACVLVATGKAQNQPLLPGSAAWHAFAAGVEQVLGELARAIVRDGEGATKLVAVKVRGGRSETDCLKAAYAVAESPLVKTALFASDPNWGRILAAVGRSGVEDLQLDEIAISIGGVPIVANGQPVPAYDEADVARVMQGAEYDISIAIGRGAAEVTVLTCDFSYDYVKINAEYRS